MTCLCALDVEVHFGGVRALDGVSVSVERGAIVGLIGPNGAGKTTLVNVLTGFQRVSQGKVFLKERDATRWSPQQFARDRVVRTFQSVRLFSDLTVLENAELGLLGVRGGRRRKARNVALQLLKELHLSDKASQRANALAHGEARRLGIVRALAADPHFLLLDEPGAGLNEREIDDLIKALYAIRQNLNCALLVIEHDMRLIMKLCETIYVLNYGKTISHGAPSDVRSDPTVIQAYLGDNPVDALP